MLQHPNSIPRNYLNNAKVVNISFGNPKLPGIFSSEQSNFPHMFTNKIIVCAGGNNRENVSLGGWSDALISIILFAGELHQNRTMNEHSGQPGENTAIQESFVWIPSKKVMAATGHRDGNQYSLVNGTSMSAAILTGATAELMRRFPELSPAEIKECLLESSDPCTYPGKGILNLNNAILYATFKSKGKQDIKTRLTRLNSFKEKQAATFLQKAWGKYKSNVKDFPKRRPLRIDLSKPGFKYKTPLYAYQDPLYAVSSEVVRPGVLDIALIQGHKSRALELIMAGHGINPNLIIVTENENSQEFNAPHLYRTFFHGYEGDITMDITMDTTSKKQNITSWIAQTYQPWDNKLAFRFALNRLILHNYDYIDALRLKRELIGNIPDQGYVGELLQDMIRIPENLIEQSRKDFFDRFGGGDPLMWSHQIMIEAF